MAHDLSAAAPTPDQVMAVLGHLLAQAGGAASQIGGAMEVWVGGPDGGRWRVDFAQGLVTRAQTSAPPAQTQLLATPAAIEALWQGAEAITFYRATGQIQVRGDRRKLQMFAALLARRSSPLGTRFSRGRSSNPPRRAE